MQYPFGDIWGHKGAYNRVIYKLLNLSGFKSALLAAFGTSAATYRSQEGVVGSFPAHVRKPARHERREPIQDFDADGQFAGDLSAALRRLNSRGTRRRC